MDKKELSEAIVNVYNATIQYARLSRVVCGKLGTSAPKNLSPENFHITINQTADLCEKYIRKVKRAGLEGFDVSYQTQVLRELENTLETIRTLDIKDENYKESESVKLEEVLEDLRSTSAISFKQIGQVDFDAILNDISQKLIQVEQAFQEGKLSPEKAKKHVLKLQNSHKSLANRVTEFNKDSYERMGKLITYYTETYQKEPLAEEITESAEISEDLMPEVIDTMKGNATSLENYMTFLKMFNNFHIGSIGIDNYDIQEQMKKVMMTIEDQHSDWDSLAYQVRELRRRAEIVHEHKMQVDSKLKIKGVGFQAILNIGEMKSEEIQTTTATTVYNQTMHQIGILERQLQSVREAFLSGQNYPTTIALHHLGYIQSQVREQKQNISIMGTVMHENAPKELVDRINALGENVIKNAEELGLITLKADSVAR